MFEGLIAIAVLAGLLSLGWLTHLGLHTLIGGSIVLFVVGFTIGLPAATVYHNRLRKVLRNRGDTDNAWLLSPTAQHKRLSPEERHYVLPIFFVGGFGFLLVVAGILLLAAAALRPIS